MPATMSANTRATRSRFSSPQIATDPSSSSRGSQAAGGSSTSGTNAGTATTNGTAATTANGADAHKTFMQRWLEPPVQVKASYQDAGLVRQGVFENMAPLGTLPKVGLFKKTAPPPAAAPEQTPVRKIVIKQKPAVPSTPVPAPAPEEDETEEDETEEEEEDDDDGQTEDQNEDARGYEDEGGAPVASTARTESHKAQQQQQRARRSVTSGETDDEEWAPGAAGAARQNGRARRSVSMASSGSALQQAAGGAAADVGSRRFDLGEFVGKVVEAAVDEALAHFRYPTAWALRTLYDENSANRDFLDMMQKVFLQTANADTLQEFARLIEAKKRDGKKDNKACYYFVPPATNTRFTPHEPKRAPYGHLVKLDMSALRLQQQEEQPQQPQQPESQKQQSQQEQFQQQQETAPVKSHKRGRPAKAPPAPETERAAAPSEQPTTEAVDTEPELPPRKKRKAGRQQAAATPSASAKMRAHGANGKAAKAAKTETPSRKRGRARSVSSISSLSSARSLSPPPDEVQGEDEDEDEEGGGRDGRDGGDDENEGFDETPSRTSPAAAPARQPIRATKRRRSNAPRRSRNVSPSRPSPAASTTAASSSRAAATTAATAATTTTATPSQRQSPAAALAEDQPYEMPAVVDSPLFPNLNSKKGSKAGTPTLVLATKLGKLDPTDPKLRLRRQARIVTNQAFPISGVRGASQPPPAAASSSSDQQRDDQDQEQPTPAPPATPATTTLASRSRTSLPSARPTPAPREGRSTRSALKRTYDDLEDQPSPTAGGFPGSAAASTAADSRAGTPALRPAKKPRTGLRVKNSPMKKKNGTSAGIPRPSGERSSPVGNAPREDDNDDYCSSCGGNGELICCDGCTRSFHFSCVDPILRHDAMPVEWFCNVCRTGRDAARLPLHDGSFAQMLEKLDAKNSSAYRLPGPVRNRFEGVRTGVDGEYEDIANVVKPPPARKKKNDEDQVPDFFRIRDNDGNAVICHSCQQGSAPDRAIIACSVCALYWHLDCLDPPLPYPPVLRTWKCPLHTDDLVVTGPGVMGPAHRYRKVKDAPVIRPTFSRGYVNNGFVEVELEDSENESGWRDVETYGRTVRLNEKGIKLDFLSRVLMNNARPKPAPTVPPAAAVPRPLDQRSLEEQRAALNLAQLSGSRDDGISTLVNAMISHADPSVIDIMGRADPAHLASAQELDQMDQQSLRAMLSRAESMADNIRRLLATGPGLPQPAAAASIPAAAPQTAATPTQALPPAEEAEEAPALALSPVTPQSPEPESDNSANMMNADSSAMELDAPASPATTDDVPAMTQGEKTPVLGDQSPAAPSLPMMEEGTPVGNGGGPVTPSKGVAVGEEPVVMGEGDKEGGIEGVME